VDRLTKSLISSLSRRHIMELRLPSYTCLRLYVYMEYLRRSCPTEDPNSRQNFSSPYHPQTDGQTKMTNQVLEDMLIVCELKYGKSWDKRLPYTKFCTIIVIKQASRWHLLKWCMDGSVGPHCFGVRREKAKCLDRKY
jgi:hypothetical protein